MASTVYTKYSYRDAYLCTPANETLRPHNDSLFLARAGTTVAAWQEIELGFRARGLSLIISGPLLFYRMIRASLPRPRLASRRVARFQRAGASLRGRTHRPAPVQRISKAQLFCPACRANASAANQPVVRCPGCEASLSRPRMLFPGLLFR